MSKNEEGLNVVEGGHRVGHDQRERAGLWHYMSDDQGSTLLRGHRVGQDAAAGLSAQDAAVRPTTAAQKRWEAHVAGWARSGLSCKEFAVQVGVHPGTLAAWKSKLGRAQAAAPTFVSVQWTGGDPASGSGYMLA